MEYDFLRRVRLLVNISLLPSVGLWAQSLHGKMEPWAIFPWDPGGCPLGSGQLSPGVLVVFHWGSVPEETKPKILRSNSLEV